MVIINAKIAKTFSAIIAIFFIVIIFHSDFCITVLTLRFGLGVTRTVIHDTSARLAYASDKKTFQATFKLLLPLLWGLRWEFLFFVFHWIS